MKNFSDKVEFVERIKFAIDCIDSIDALELEIDNMVFKLKELPIIYKPVDLGKTNTYVSLCSLLKLKDIQKLIEKEHDKLMSTLDGDPFDLTQEPFKYLNPVNDEIFNLLPSLNILISDIKKMMGKKVENISNFRFINENFNELGES